MQLGIRLFDDPKLRERVRRTAGDEFMMIE